MGNEGENSTPAQGRSVFAGVFLPTTLLKESPIRLVLVDGTNSMTTIAKYPVGRVLLHLMCIARHPAHFKWHLRGIGREVGVGLKDASSSIPRKF
jgi:hypothetical protein